MTLKTRLKSTHPHPYSQNTPFLCFFSCQVFKVDISLVLDHHWIGTRIWWRWPEISLHPCRPWPFPKWQPLQLPSCMPLFGRIKPWQARNRQIGIGWDVFLGGVFHVKKNRELGKPIWEALNLRIFVSCTFVSHCRVVFLFSNRNIPTQDFCSFKIRRYVVSFPLANFQFLSLTMKSWKPWT